MSYRQLDSRRIRSLLNEALEDHEIRSFISKNQKFLITSGERLQNLPKDRSTALAALVKILNNERAVKSAEIAFRKLLTPTRERPVNEVLQDYLNFLQATEAPPTGDLRECARLLLFHLLGDGQSEVLREFFKRPEVVAPQQEEPQEANINSALTEVEIETLSALQAGLDERLVDLPENGRSFISGLRALRDDDLAGFRVYQDQLSPEDIRYALLESSLARYVETRKSSQGRLGNVSVVRPIMLDSVDEIDAENAEFLGICRGEAGQHLAKRPSIIDVIGIWKDGHLLGVPSELLSQLLPDQGLIIAFEGQSVSRPVFDEVGVWQVQEFPTDKSIKVRISRQLRQVFELVDLPVEAGQYDSLREQIQAYKIKSNMRPIFRLTDGSIVKPPRDHHEFVAGALDEPLEGWKSLPVVRIKGRQFVVGPLPNAQYYLDCRSTERLLPLLLRATNQQLSLGITKKGLQQIAEGLQHLQTDIDLRRVRRIQRAVVAGVARFDGLTSLSDELIKLPAAKAMLEERAKQVEAEIEAKRADLVNDVKRLQAEKSTLESAIREKNQEQAKLPGQVAKRVKEAFTTALRDGEKMLADTGLISVLLKSELFPAKSVAPSSYQPPEGRDAPVVPTEKYSRSVEIEQPVQQEIAAVLKALGVPQALARRFGFVIQLAVSAGLVIAFRGTAGSIAARQVARAIAQTGVARAIVSVGAVEPLMLGPCSGAHKAWDVACVENCDLAPFESYGQQILDLVVEGLLEHADATGIAVVCSLADSIASLPFSPAARGLVILINIDSHEYPVSSESLGDWHARLVDEEQEGLKASKPWSLAWKRLMRVLSSQTAELSEVLPIIEKGLYD